MFFHVETYRMTKNTIFQFNKIVFLCYLNLNAKKESNWIDQNKKWTFLKNKVIEMQRKISHIKVWSWARKMKCLDVTNRHKTVPINTQTNTHINILLLWYIKFISCVRLNCSIFFYFRELIRPNLSICDQL